MGALPKILGFLSIVGVIVFVAIEVIKRLDPIFVRGASVGFCICLAMEFIGGIMYLRWRICSKQKNSKISLKMMKLEVKELFGEEVEEETVQRYRNRDFFINKFSHEKKLMSKVYTREETFNFTSQDAKLRGETQSSSANPQLSKAALEQFEAGMKTANQKTPKNKQQVESATQLGGREVTSGNNLNEAQNGLHQQQPPPPLDLQQRHILEEIGTMKFEKVGKEIYLAKVNQFRKFLEIFMSVEKSFTRDLRGIGKPRFLKTYMFDIVVARDKRNPPQLYKFSALDANLRGEFLQLVQLNESKSGSFDSMVITLPSWHSVKNLFFEMSRIHEHLVEYIQFGTLDLAKALIEEYEDSYKKLKVMKKETKEAIQRKFEEAKEQEITYREISRKIKDLASIYEKQHSSQQKELARKRVELKGEIELLLYDKNNSKIKVNAGFEALNKAKRDAERVNAKIFSHKKEWEKRFQSLFKTSMKSLISGFFELSKDLQKNMKTILTANMKSQQSPQTPTRRNFDLQSFDDDDLSAYSSINGSEIDWQQAQKSRNTSFYTESFLGNVGGGGAAMNRSMMNNQSLVNPQLVCTDHRQQLAELMKSAESFERDYYELEKYEDEVSILMEDVVAALSTYIEELAQKISTCEPFSKLGEAILYEQLGSCIQIDVTNNSQRFLKELAGQISKYLKPFQQSTQKAVSILQLELKTLRKHISIVQDLQSSLEKAGQSVAQQRESLMSFQQKYDLLKGKFDAAYEKLYVTKAAVERAIASHQTAVEEYKRLLLNQLVIFTNQFADKLEIIENNSDMLLTQDEEDEAQKAQDNSSSVRSQASTLSARQTYLKRSSIKMGSEFMHQYENDDEVDGGGGAELTNEMRLSHDPKNRKAAKIITKLLKVFYRQWKDTDYFKEKIKKELYISLNKKLDDSLEEMVITKLIIKGEGPDIKSIVQQPSEENEFQMDIEISYKGTIYFEVDTAYYLDWPMPDSYKLPLTVKIKLNEFYSILRVCYVPRAMGKSWFSFIGEPVISVDIDPIISKKYRVARIPRVQSIIQEIISSKIKKMTFPNRDSIKIPMSKADMEISAIREKLLHKKDASFMMETSQSPPQPPQQQQQHQHQQQQYPQTPKVNNSNSQMKWQ